MPAMAFLNVVTNPVSFDLSDNMPVRMRQLSKKPEVACTRTHKTRSSKTQPVTNS